MNNGIGLMKIIAYCFATLLFVATSLAQADNVTPSVNLSSENLTEEAKKGELLHTMKCMTSCHTDSVYIRENRTITHYEELKTQVERCTKSLGIGWWPDDEEMLAVITFLNEKYYKFDKLSD
jgi:hypothetical protein